MKIPPLKVEYSPDHSIDEPIASESDHKEPLHLDIDDSTHAAPANVSNDEKLRLVDEETTGKHFGGIGLVPATEERGAIVSPAHPNMYDPETYAGSLIDSGQLGREDVTEALVGKESITGASPIANINVPSMKDNDNIALSINSLLGQIATSAGLNPETALIKNQPAPQPHPQPMSSGGGGSLFSRLGNKPESALPSEKDINFQLHRAADLIQNHGEKIAQAAEGNPDLKSKLESLGKSIEQAGKNDKTISESIKSLGEAMGKLFEKMFSKLSKSDKGPSLD